MQFLIREAAFEKISFHAALEVDCKDPLFGSTRILFRRTSANARVTIFDGGHDILPAAGLNWLAGQVKSEKEALSI